MDTRPPESRPLAGAPVASLRCRTLRPGLASIILFRLAYKRNVCRNGHRRVINTLVLLQFRWPVLKWPRMAGFQVATEASRNRTAEM